MLKLLIMIRKRIGPNLVPWGTPAFTGSQCDVDYARDTAICDSLLSLDVALCSCKTFSLYQKFLSGLLILRNATGKRRHYGKLAASILFQKFSGCGYPRLVRKYMLYGLQRRVRSIAAVN